MRTQKVNVKLKPKFLIYAEQARNTSMTRAEKLRLLWIQAKAAAACMCRKGGDGDRISRSEGDMETGLGTRLNYRRRRRRRGAQGHEGLRTDILLAQRPRNAASWMPQGNPSSSRGGAKNDIKRHQDGYG